MKPEDIKVWCEDETMNWWRVTDQGNRRSWRADFTGLDAQQYAEEHAQKLRDKLPNPRWTVHHGFIRDRDHFPNSPVNLYTAVEHRLQAIADLLNELEP